MNIKIEKKLITYNSCCSFEAHYLLTFSSMYTKLNSYIYNFNICMQIINIWTNAYM